MMMTSRMMLWQWRRLWFWPQDGLITSYSSAPTWIIDPIDGTMNFVHSNPIVCTSVGLTINKKLVAGLWIQLLCLWVNSKSSSSSSAASSSSPLWQVWWTALFWVYATQHCEVRELFATARGSRPADATIFPRFVWLVKHLSLNSTFDPRDIDDHHHYHHHRPHHRDHHQHLVQAMMIMELPVGAKKEKKDVALKNLSVIMDRWTNHN